MNNYSIYIRFRGEEIKAHVQVYEGAHTFVSFTNETILQDFTGQMEFVNNKYVPGYVRNKDATDLFTLVTAVEKQLR